VEESEGKPVAQYQRAQYNVPLTTELGISVTTEAVVKATQPYVRDGCSRACHKDRFWKNLGTTAFTMVGGIRMIMNVVNTHLVLHITYCVAKLPKSEPIENYEELSLICLLTP
jgi:hypothetical protein